MSRCALYRHFADDGALLYVGISLGPIGRLEQHMDGAEWAGSIATVRVEWHETRVKAEAAETAAIRQERPLYNRRSAIGPEAEAHPVLAVLAHWPSRVAILEDVRAVSPGIELHAIHKWHQSKRVPARHMWALMQGAKRRGLPITAQDLVDAHSRHSAPVARDAA